MAIVHFMSVEFKFPRVLSDCRLKVSKLMYRKPLGLSGTIQNGRPNRNARS
jgi:hypothetical protein